MFIISIFRVLKFSWQGFWRNFWLSLTTITVIVLVFVSVNILIIVNYISNATVTSVQDKVDVSINFVNNLTEDKIFEVIDFLKTTPEVKSTEYTSQEKVLENFRQLHKNDQVILQALSEIEQNPFGATLDIKANNISDYEKIISILDNSKYNDIIRAKNFDNHKSFIDKIVGISGRIYETGIALTIIFVAIACLIVFNTIRVAIYTHKEEIGIMKLVGANNFFIMAPFLVEGIVYGIIGYFLAAVTTLILINLLQPYLTNFFTGITVDIISYFWIHFLLISAVELGGIIILNIISCSIAIRKYLKV